MQPNTAPASSSVRETDQAVSSRRPNGDDAMMRSSWFQEMLQQGTMTEDELRSFLQESNPATADGATTQHDSISERINDEDEIAEQHKIMAFHEAKKFLNANMGYDVEEAAKQMMIEEKKRKDSNQCDPTPPVVYSVYPEKPPPFTIEASKLMSLQTT